MPSRIEEIYATPFKNDRNQCWGMFHRFEEVTGFEDALNELNSQGDNGEAAGGA